MSEILLLILAVAFFSRRGRARRGAADPWPGILVEAERRGTITEAQRTALLAQAAEAGAPQARLAGVAWLGMFAGLFVVAGISLLIARNWDEIGPTVRVAGFVALLASAGEAAIRFQGRSLAASVPLELVWFFLPLLGIGLYGQTFQLTGDPLSPFLVWLALGLPLAWASERRIIATIHTFTLAAVLFAGNYVAEPAALFIGATRGVRAGLLSLTSPGGHASAWVLSAALLATIAVQSLRILPRQHRHQFVGIIAVWIFCLLVASTPFHLRHEAWLALGALGLATLWVAILVALDTSFEERAAGVGVWLAVIYGLTFTWHVETVASGSTTTLGILVVGGATAAAIACIVALPTARLSPDPTWALGMKVMLVAPLAVAGAFFTDDVQLIWCAAAMLNLLLLAIAVGLMWHGSLVREAAQVNLGVLILVGVLVTRFLDVFGNMLRSGLGFIVAGLLLAGLSWALERTRRRLLSAPPGVSA